MFVYKNIFQSIRVPKKSQDSESYLKCRKIPGGRCQQALKLYKVSLFIPADVRLKSIVHCVLKEWHFLRWLNCFWLSYFWISTFILASPMTLVGLSQWTDWKSAKPHRWDFSWVDPNVCGLSENQQKYFASHFARLRFKLESFDIHRIKVLLDADEHRQGCSSHCYTQKVDSGTLALGLAPGLRLALWLGPAVRHWNWTSIVCRQDEKSNEK